jgi:exonuclease III
MKILHWNIQQGGGRRIPRIVETILAHQPDIVTFNEFRSQPGVPLVSMLGNHGWTHRESTMPPAGENGICVLSRISLRRGQPCPLPPRNQARWLDIEVPNHNFSVTAVHIMCSVPKEKDGRPVEAKTRFWNSVLHMAEGRLQTPCLLVGDFNTGAHFTDEIGKTYVCAGHFERLSSLGWTDLWRHHNRGPTEWTWFSKLKGGFRGNGFRLDHAFASPLLLPRVSRCYYSHSEREARISDHSALILEVD